MQKQLIVIGGGAAGFFCAVNAARLNPQLKVTIIEKSNQLLAKVKVSGGGRCNVTHACFDIPELVKCYPRGQNFIKKAFHWFDPTNTIQWFAERGVSLKEEADGRMFPESNDSQTIIDCLLKEAAKYKVEIVLKLAVKHLQFDVHGCQLLTTNAQRLTPNYICIASGGYPKSTLFDWLRNIGHTIESPVPSLFTFNIPNHPISALMGVSVEKASVKIAGSKLVAEGPLLITHWGMSGPVILRLSAWGARHLGEANYDFTIVVNWLPDYQEQYLRTDWVSLRVAHAAQKIGHKNPFGLPNRLWGFLLTCSNIHPDIHWADLTAKAQNLLIKNITAQYFSVKGKTTFKEEFVTCGGIKLNEIDPNTMQSKIHPEIFFAGEVMDVDGITGGFNFQHAWTSGWIAANAIADLAKK